MTQQNAINVFLGITLKFNVIKRIKLNIVPVNNVVELFIRQM